MQSLNSIKKDDKILEAYGKMFEKTEYGDDDWVVLVNRKPKKYMKNPKSNKAPEIPSSMSMSSKDSVEVMRISSARKKGIIKEEYICEMSPADKHQLKVLVDTVRNPLKGMFLGGPSAEEAEEILKKKFKWNDKQIKKIKMSANVLKK